MSQRILLAAIVARDGRVFLTRREGEPWQLPAGALPDGHDVDQAMDEILAAHGVHAPAIEEDFVRTAYLGVPGDGVVLNLYAPTEWTGEPSAGDGYHSDWFEVAGLESVEMDPGLRTIVAEAFGLAPAEGTDSDFAMLAAINEGLAAQAPVHRHAPSFPSRREAGLDVLRTLNGIPGERAAKQMEAMYGALAGDVLDFALGSVWASPVIDRKTRSLQVVAMIAAMGGAPGPLRSHVNGALNHGATPEELVETMRMVAVYAGFPVALEAWRVMEKVVAGRGYRLSGAPR